MHAMHVQERTLRLIEIAGVDVNPCGGTHVASTAELQALRVVGFERARGGTRLRVLVGGRLLSALGRVVPREAALSKVSPYLNLPRRCDGPTRMIGMCVLVGRPRLLSSIGPLR